MSCTCKSCCGVDDLEAPDDIKALEAPDLACARAALGLGAVSSREANLLIEDALNAQRAELKSYKDECEALRQRLARIYRMVTTDLAES